MIQKNNTQKEKAVIIPILAFLIHFHTKPIPLKLYYYIRLSNLSQKIDTIDKNPNTYILLSFKRILI